MKPGAAMPHATIRSAEAEPLRLPALLIFFTFGRHAGHQHPDRDAAVVNYTNVLSAMGRGRGGVRLSIADLRRQAGLS
jgi:hypothetical protein